MAKNAGNGIGVLVLGFGLAAAAPAGLAGDVHTVSANVALTSDYRFRGISQNDEGLALQGGFDYAYNPLGIYLGTWASSIEFQGGTSDPASVEVDFYGGVSGELGNGLGWDVGGIYYWYPQQNEEGTSEFDYVEAYGSLSYTFSGVALQPAVSGSIFYSPDFFGETGDAVYLNGGLELSLPWELKLAGEVGWQDVDKAGDYVHWRIGISRDIIPGLGIDVSYYDADDDCQLVGGAADLCDATVIGTISASFDLL